MALAHLKSSSGNLANAANFAVIMFAWLYSSTLTQTHPFHYHKFFNHLTPLWTLVPFHQILESPQQSFTTHFSSLPRYNPCLPCPPHPFPTRQSHQCYSQKCHSSNEILRTIPWFLCIQKHRSLATFSVLPDGVYRQGTCDIPKW